MSSHLLFIDCGTFEHSSLHPSRDEAWSALVVFVEENWASTLPNVPLPVTADSRVETFFTATGWFYLIAAISVDRPDSSEPVL